MVTINPNWDTILNPVPSTSTAFGGTWAMFLSKLLNGQDIELDDPNKIPLMGTSFYYKSGKLRVLDTEGSHYLKFVLDNIDSGNDKTLRIREFSTGDEDYLVTENEPTELFGKTINADENTITNLTNSSIATGAAIGWAKINTTGSKLQDMKNINTATLGDGQVLQYNQSMDMWLPLTPPSSSSITGIVGGTVLKSGDGSTLTFSWPHGMSTTPTTVSVEPGTSATRTNTPYITWDAINITATYITAPSSGTNNLSFIWMASNASGTSGNMVYTGQANTFGSFNQTIPSGNLRLSNGGFFGSFQTTLTASRLWTFPDGAGTALLDTLAQTMTNKTINVDSNTLKHSTSNSAGRLLKSNGTKFDTFAIGTAGKALVVNSGATDLVWEDRQKPITISNLGVDGEPVIKQLTSGGILEVYRISSGSDKVSVDLDTVDNTIVIDVDEQWLNLVDMGGNLPYNRLTLANSIVNADITEHVSTKISITDKDQLNDQIVYKDAGATFGDVDYYFHDNRFYIRNPAGTYAYQFIGGAITGNRSINLPVVPAGTYTMSLIEATQTLTNKTLTAPTIATILNGTGTITLPVNVNTTLVGRNTTDTLTNKTLTAPVISTIINGTGTITLPINANTTLIGASELVTLTNKTLSLSSNTVTAGSMATGDLVTYNGTKLERKAKGTFLQGFGVNKEGTDTEFFTQVFRSIWDGYNVGLFTGSGSSTDDGLLNGTTTSAVTSADGKDTYGPYRSLSTGTSSGTVAGKKKTDPFTSLAEYAYLAIRWSVSSVLSTDTRCYVGFHTNTGTTAVVNGNTFFAAGESGVGAGYRTTDTNWQVIRSDGTTPVYQDTGIAKDTLPHKLEIRADPTNTRWLVKFDSLSYTYTTSIPAMNTDLTYRSQILNVNAADHNIKLRGTLVASRLSW